MYMLSANELQKDMAHIESQILRLREDVRNAEDNLELLRAAEQQAQGALHYLRQKVTQLPKDEPLQAQTVELAEPTPSEGDTDG